jgi:UDP-N-acetylglucosamine acyltransferase
MSTPKIHTTAVIDPSAQIGADVEIGAYTVIGPDCVVGDGTVLGPHVVLEQFTELGQLCQVRAGAVLGGPPQDNKFKGERSFVRVGDRTQIREFVTIHRSTGEDEATTIGDDNLIMAYVHIGHNCVVGNKAMLSSYAGLSGHIHIEDYVIVGGMIGMHQFVRVGRYAMLGGYSKVVQDVPPFMLADGRPADVLDLNVRGLRRAGIDTNTRSSLKQAYKLLYRSNMNRTQALEAIAEELEPNPELDYLVQFIERMKDGTSGRQEDRPRR